VRARTMLAAIPILIALILAIASGLPEPPQTNHPSADSSRPIGLDACRPPPRSAGERLSLLYDEFRAGTKIDTCSPSPAAAKGSWRP
jgi:hypothetical protein